MYLAIDFGATKTLVVVYSDKGEKLSENKIPTAKKYDDFLAGLKKVTSSIDKESLHYCVAGVPGLVDRARGKIIAFGNLNWRNVPIRDDIHHILGGKVQVSIENDARLAGLAEAIASPSKYDRVLYFTISTGIGGAFIVNNKIVRALEDTEMGKMPLIHKGKLTHWEDFASGRALVEDFGQEVSNITSQKDWEQIGERIAYGTAVACSFLQPEVIIYGGGAGQYADKFTPIVSKYLKENLHVVINQPKELMGPTYGYDSVPRGCYELARQKYES